MDLRTLKELEDLKAMREASRFVSIHERNGNLELHYNGYIIAETSKDKPMIINNKIKEVDIGKYEN